MSISEAWFALQNIFMSMWVNFEIINILTNYTEQSPQDHLVSKMQSRESPDLMILKLIELIQAARPGKTGPLRKMSAAYKILLDLFEKLKVIKKYFCKFSSSYL